MNNEDAETMTPSTAEDYKELLPREPMAAVDALGNDKSKAIIACLIEEGPRSYSELEDTLGIASGSLSNALDPLRDAGLVSKQIVDSEGEPYRSRYKVTPFGKRFVSCLYSSLGTVDQTPRQRRAENYSDLETGEEPLIGWNEPTDESSSDGTAVIGQ